MQSISFVLNERADYLYSTIVTLVSLIFHLFIVNPHVIWGMSFVLVTFRMTISLTIRAGSADSLGSVENLLPDLISTG